MITTTLDIRMNHYSYVVWRCDARSRLALVVRGYFYKHSTQQPQITIAVSTKYSGITSNPKTGIDQAGLTAFIDEQIQDLKLKTSF